jgi:hypothetical protein
LERADFNERDRRFGYRGLASVREIKWVGVAEAPNAISAGTLVRVSLSRRHQPSGRDEDGCWLQISGTY